MTRRLVAWLARSGRRSVPAAMALWVAGAGGPDPALAQLDPWFEYAQGSEFIPSTPGVAGGAVGVFYNPAAWATVGRTEAAFWWNDTSVRGSSLDNWGLSVGKNLGFSVQSRTADTGAGTSVRSQDYQLGLAGGDRRAHLGVAWRWSGGDDLRRHAGLSLGTVIRPSRAVSVGLSGFFEDAVDPDQGLLDLGIRPFANSWLTVFGDYAVVDASAGDDGAWGAGVEVRPYRGLHAGVRFQEAEGPDDFGYRIYAGVTLESLGFFGMPGYQENGDLTGTSYLIRIEPPYRGLRAPRLGSARTPRVVPVDLENRTLAYRQARWFDDKHVPWIQLARRLETLRQDDAVGGVALNLAGFRASPVLQWELREKLLEFRRAGKSVYIHADRLDMGRMYLASVADRISLDPQGEILLSGLALHRTYYRGFLDRVGLGVEEWRHLSHKSAFETFTRKDMSEVDREQFGRVTDVIYETWRGGIAAGRGLAEADVDSLVEQEVLLTARRAQARGLVDRLGRWPDFREEIRKATDAKVAGIAPDRDRSLVPDERWGRPPEIALVYALGPCEMDDGIEGRATGKRLRALAKDDDVAAVVLRADSPGGDPLPADLVREGTRKLRDADKPVVVSQGSVAASGGYWISMEGSRILTTPLTLTGSIGVIAGWVWDDGAGEKSGFTSDGVQRGSHADLFTGTRFPILGFRLPTRNLTETEKAQVKSLMLELYDGFVGMVAEARDLPEARVRELAEGRVWMGPDAMERGLVDTLGTLDDAIREARRLAGLDPEEEILLTEYPPRPHFPKFRFLPEIPGLGLLARSLFGTRPAYTDDEAEFYEAAYLRFLARADARPLLLTPPESMPEGWRPSPD